MSIPLVQCHGECGREKLAIHFIPRQLTAAHPMCRACQAEQRKKYRVMGSGRPRGWGFRADAAVLCPGSTFSGGVR